ncbi:MAG TPA: tripartite tricarboxylate transporter substrate binding protein [Syntrophorhabdales bacterium]|nr:tripartite tricarboxylate transporter substrate binding protein [Syntrophorhabdales bacterium]
MKIHWQSGKFVAAVALSILLLASSFLPSARAEYPDRPITMDVAFAPGGSMDMASRAMASAAEKYLGKPIVVDNKGGAAGTIALALVANAKPDGYTLCAGTSTGIVRAPQMQKVTYKPLKSFTPIIGYATPQNAIVVKSDAPWKSLKELLDYARKNPNKIKYSSTGVGSAQHHAMAYLEHQEKIKWIHVPYKGTADAMTALLGGHVDVCSSGPEHVPYARAGQVRILAYTEEKRNPKQPDVPTLKELGYDFVNETVFSILGPAGLPADVVAKLESAFTKAKDSPEVKTVMDKLDLVPVYYNSKEYDRFLKESWVRLEKTLKETGLIKEPATQPY